MFHVTCGRHEFRFTARLKPWPWERREMGIERGWQWKMALLPYQQGGEHCQDFWRIDPWSDLKLRLKRFNLWSLILKQVITAGVQQTSDGEALVAQILALAKKKKSEGVAGDALYSRPVESMFLACEWLPICVATGWTDRKSTKRKQTTEELAYARKTSQLQYQLNVQHLVLILAESG